MRTQRWVSIEWGISGGEVGKRDKDDQSATYEILREITKYVLKQKTS